MLNLVCDFLILAVHTLLNARKLYPQESFEIKRKYDIPVKISKSTELCHYITDVIGSIQQWIEEASLCKVVVNIYDTEDTILERFVFDIEYTLTSSAQQISDASVCDFLLKMSTLNATLAPLPQGCTFSIFVHGDFDCSDLAYKEEKLKLVNSSIFPLKSVTCENVKVQVYVEQINIK